MLLNIDAPEVKIDLYIVYLLFGDSMVFEQVRNDKMQSHGKYSNNLNENMNCFKMNSL